MAIQTKPTNASVVDFIEAVDNKGRRDDAKSLLHLLERTTGYPAVMWGDSLIGFGAYDYVYKTGHSGQWPLIAFSPRKANMVVYLMDGCEHYTGYLDQMGPYKLGKSCLYLGRLSNLNMDILEQVIVKSYEVMKEKYSV